MRESSKFKNIVQMHKRVNSFRIHSLKREKGGKLSYCSVIPSMWKYHSIMLWMLHVLIMLFSSRGERGKQQPESECGWKKMEARNFLQHTEKCYLFLWENENVSQRTRYTALRLSFGLWFASFSFSFHFGFFFFTLISAMRWGKGLKRFHDNSPRLAWWYIFVSMSQSRKTFLLQILKLENPWNVMKRLDTQLQDFLVAATRMISFVIFLNHKSLNFA